MHSHCRDLVLGGHPGPPPQWDSNEGSHPTPTPRHLVKIEADLLVREEEPKDACWGDLLGRPGAVRWGLTRTQGRDCLEASEIKTATGAR